MPLSLSNIATLWDALQADPGAPGRVFADRAQSLNPAHLIDGTSLGGRASELAGRSILIATRGQAAAAMAMIELDGIARRMVICPPDIKPVDLNAVIADAEIDAIVCDGSDEFADLGLPLVPCHLPITPTENRLARQVATEWVLLTSGTTGRPKMVVHGLAGLTGAIRDAPVPNAALVWATFYDIRRYGGLQIFLRAVLGGGSLILSSTDEPVAEHLARLGNGGVTHISGTPSHWRRVLMSQAIHAMAPGYIRLSGEIADQPVLDGLRDAYPHAAVGHAYASTEAGVGFDVNDGLEGFPASLTERTGVAVEMKVVDGSLRIRSMRTASRYVGPTPLALMDEDAFVDTGDMLERRGDRYYFVGRRGGIVNVGGLKVHPEEVESAINSHPTVRMSLVTARKNPFTGAIVVADVVLDDDVHGDLRPEAAEALKLAIQDTCRQTLDRHKVPVAIRFVPALDMTPSGKLRRLYA